MSSGCRRERGVRDGRYGRQKGRRAMSREKRRRCRASEGCRNACRPRHTDATTRAARAARPLTWRFFSGSSFGPHTDMRSRATASDRPDLTCKQGGWGGGRAREVSVGVVGGGERHGQGSSNTRRNAGSATHVGRVDLPWPGGGRGEGGREGGRETGSARHCSSSGDAVARGGARGTHEVLRARWRGVGGRVSECARASGAGEGSERAREEGPNELAVLRSSACRRSLPAERARAAPPPPASRF